MQILYAVTLCAKNKPGSGLLRKIKLVAKDQVQAVEIAAQKAKTLNLEVLRVEELEPMALGSGPLFSDSQTKEDLWRG
jgi:hypothetical protein